MAELLKVREITIDTMQHKDFATKEEELKVMRFYQNDLNSAKLLITVTHDKVVTDFSTATKVQIAFLKPDGKRVFQDVQNVNQMQGKYYVVLSTQTLIAYGNVVAQLRLTFPNNKVIETCKFVFAVDESIMSDEAMVSTNEFPVIQKAIEVGETFTGVDFAPIIKAGELAAGALPKTGGTMTGNIRIDKSPASGTGWRSISWDLENSEAIRMGLNGSNYFVLWDAPQNVIPFEYRPATKEVRLGSGATVNVLGDSNLYKKTDLYPSWVTPTGNATQLPTGTDLNTVATSGIYGGASFVNSPDGGTDAAYIEVWTYGNYIIQRFVSMTGSNRRSFVRRKSGSTWGGWQKEILDDGGTLTGEIDIKKNIPAMNFTIADGSKVARLLYNAGPTSDFGFQIMTPTGKAYLRTTGDAATREIATKEKDGRVTLTLTADGENPTTNTPPTAIRRGNTVTITGSFRRKAGATGSLLTVLPTDMVPTVTQKFHALASDGTSVYVTISSSTGNIDFSVAGKEVYLQCTYVVD